MIFGVYGSGSIGKRHIANIKTIVPDAEFILFRRHPLEDEFSRSINARVEKAGSEVIKECDAIVVANPSSHHMKVIEQAIANHIPCYVEKPVVTEKVDLEKLEKVNFPVSMVGCNLRYLGSLKVLRELLVGGKIGKPVRATVEAGQWLPSWRPASDYRESYSAKKALGGGVIFDLIHEIDLSRWLFGEFAAVKSAYGKFSDLEIETEDAASIILAGKVIVSVNVDYISQKPRRKITIIGTEGNLVWDMQAKTLLVETAAGTENIDCGNDGFNVQQTYVEAMWEFIKSVKSGKSTSQDLVEGLKTAKLAIMAKQQ